MRETSKNDGEEEEEDDEGGVEEEKNRYKFNNNKKKCVSSVASNLSVCGWPGLGGGGRACVTVWILCKTQLIFIIHFYFLLILLYEKYFSETEEARALMEKKKRKTSGAHQAVAGGGKRGRCGQRWCVTTCNDTHNWYAFGTVPFGASRRRRPSGSQVPNHMPVPFYGFSSSWYSTNVVFS